MKILTEQVTHLKRLDHRYGSGRVREQMGTAQIGYGALSEDEQLRNARQTIALARAGVSLADRAVTPVLAAQLRALEARGHALLGDANATRRAVREAERHYERSHPEGEPSWLSFYTEASFATDIGKGLCDIGNPTRRPS